MRFSHPSPIRSGFLRRGAEPKAGGLGTGRVLTRKKEVALIVTPCFKVMKYFEQLYYDIFSSFVFNSASLFFDDVGAASNASEKKL